MLLRCYRDGADPKLPDGWFPTGDLGEIEPDGRLTVHGRRGDLIITGGENVWPEAVEADCCAPTGRRRRRRRTPTTRSGARSSRPSSCRRRRRPSDPRRPPRPRQDDPAGLLRTTPSGVLRRTATHHARQDQTGTAFGCRRGRFPSVPAESCPNCPRE